MDFVVNNLFNGCWIRTLTLFDNWSHECLVIHVDQAIKGKDVVDQSSDGWFIRHGIQFSKNVTSSRTGVRSIMQSSHYLVTDTVLTWPGFTLFDQNTKRSADVL